MKRKHISKFKTSLSRRNAVSAYKERNFDKGLCTLCPTKMAENDMRTKCSACRHRHNINNMYRRHFLGDFV